MVRNPQSIFRAIFKHCDLEPQPEAVERAFSRDSQRNTTISRENLGKLQSQPLTDEIKRKTDVICDYYRVKYGVDLVLTIIFTLDYFRKHEKAAFKAQM